MIGHEALPEGWVGVDNDEFASAMQSILDWRAANPHASPPATWGEVVSRLDTVLPASHRSDSATVFDPDIGAGPSVFWLLTALLSHSSPVLTGRARRWVVLAAWTRVESKWRSRLRGDKPTVAETDPGGDQ